MSISIKYCKYCGDEIINRRESAKFCPGLCILDFNRALHNKEVFKLSDHDKLIRKKYGKD